MNTMGELIRERLHLLLLMCLLPSASAQTNLLINGSLELPGGTNYAVVSPGSTFLTGWTAMGSLGVEYFTPQNYYNFGAAEDGLYVVDLSYGTNGGLQQSFPTVSGQAYEADFWFGTLQANGRDGTAFVNATAGDTSTNIFIQTLSGFIDWKHQAFVFTATNSQTTFSLVTTNGDFGQFALVDNLGVYLISTNGPTSLAIDLYPGLMITGNVGRSYRIDYVTSIGSTNWTPLTFITLPMSPYLYFDHTSARLTSRFYRAVQIN